MFSVSALLLPSSSEGKSAKIDAKLAEVFERPAAAVAAKKDDEGAQNGADREAGAEDGSGQEVDNVSDAVSEGHEETADEKERTVFVSNVPVDVHRRHLARLFSKAGKVQSVRLRSIGVDPESKLPFHVAVYQKQFNHQRKSCHAYVKFESADDAQRAVAELNASVLEDHHLSVTLAEDEEMDKKRSVFVGNLPFDVEDEQLWKLFGATSVRRVRVIRDKRTGMGKGFALVMFRDKDDVEKALTLHGSKKIFNRELRVFKAMDMQKSRQMSSSKDKNDKNQSSWRKQATEQAEESKSQYKKVIKKRDRRATARSSDWKQKQRESAALPKQDNRESSGKRAAPKREFEGHRADPSDPLYVKRRKTHSGKPGSSKPRSNPGKAKTKSKK